MATTPTANTHHNFRNGNKDGQMQWHLTSTDTNKTRMEKERCKMLNFLIVHLGYALWFLVGYVIGKSRNGGAK